MQSGPGFSEEANPSVEEAQVPHSLIISFPATHGNNSSQTNSSNLLFRASITFFFLFCFFFFFFVHNFSMIRRLPLSATFHRFVSRRTKLISSPPKYPYYSQGYFSSLSLPFSVNCPRSIHAFKVLAMAEQTQMSSSHSHKHTNRLAAEHSPYLLQHAHNPVCNVYLFIFYCFGFSESLFLRPLIGISEN